MGGVRVIERSDYLVDFLRERGFHEMRKARHEYLSYYGFDQEYVFVLVEGVVKASVTLREGTRFNISAYDEDPDVLAALMEGSLQFESSRSTETMVPGDLITYDCRTMEASRRQVDTDQFRSWIDGIIRYDAISLPALLRRLAREYDVKIELCTDAFDDKTFRISLTEAQNIESIMGGLCDILPISARRDTCGYRVDSRPRKTEP